MPIPPSGAVKPNRTLLATPRGGNVVGVQRPVKVQARGTTSLASAVNPQPTNKMSHLKNWVR